VVTRGQLRDGGPENEGNDYEFQKRPKFLVAMDPGTGPKVSARTCSWLPVPWTIHFLCIIATNIWRP
jgi:hypothetical protein